MNPELLAFLQQIGPEGIQQLAQEIAGLPPEEQQAILQMLQPGTPGTTGQPPLPASPIPPMSGMDTNPLIPPGAPPGVPPMPNNPMDWFQPPPTDMGMGMDPSMDPSMGPIQPEMPMPPLLEKPKPKKKKPEAKEIEEKAKTLAQYWRPRNVRMKEDQDLYDRAEAAYKKEELSTSEEIGETDELQNTLNVVLNDMYTTIVKVRNLIGGSIPIIEVIPPDETQRPDAQRIEDMLYWVREELDYRWGNGLHGSLSIDEIHSLVLRGWLCTRLMFNPDDSEFPWRYSLVEPSRVFPSHSSEGELNYVIHQYSAPKMEVIGDLAFTDKIKDRLEKILKKKDDREGVLVTAYYDEEWRVLLVDNEEITDNESAYHGYGQIPWRISVFQGSPFRGEIKESYNPGTADNEFSPEWTAKVGPGIFEGLKEGYKYFCYLTSCLATEVAKSSNQPVVIFSDEASRLKCVTVDTGIGGQTNLGTADKFEVVQPYPSHQYLQALMQIVQERQNRILPSVMWGEGADTVSGFAMNIRQSQARDMLFPILLSMQRHEKWKYRFALKLYVALGNPMDPVKIIHSDRNTGAQQHSVSILPEEVKTIGYQIAVRYRNLTPQDKLATGQLTQMLYGAQLLDTETAMGEDYLGLQNPTKVRTRILSDMIYKNPLIMEQFLVPQAILETWGEEGAMMYYQFMMMQQGMMGGGGPPMPGQPPGAPQGMPPMPGQKGASNPQRVGQIPPGQLPPEMQGRTAGQASATPGVQRNLPPPQYRK